MYVLEIQTLKNPFYIFEFSHKKYFWRFQHWKTWPFLVSSCSKVSAATVPVCVFFVFLWKDRFPGNLPTFEWLSREFSVHEFLPGGFEPLGKPEQQRRRATICDFPRIFFNIKAVKFWPCCYRQTVCQQQWLNSIWTLL